QRGIEQAAGRQVFDQCGKTTVEFGQQIFFQAAEIVAMRVPPTTAKTLLRDEVIFFRPEDCDERNSRLDESAGSEQAHRVDGAAVTIDRCRRFGLDVKRLE